MLSSAGVLMGRMLGVMIAIAAGLGTAVSSLSAASEALPMPLAHYAELCRQTGGSLFQQLTGGVGIVQCRWAGHGRTDCKVGAGQVSICGISCRSNACLKENPARYTPTWPLAGGPGDASLPVE